MNARGRVRALSLILLLSLLATACQVTPPPESPPAPARPIPAPPPVPVTTPASPVPAAQPATPAEPFRNVYTLDKDSVPATPRSVDYMAIPDAVPKQEPRGKYGNKSPYTVLGRSYRVLADARGYREEGMASWYGEKFHGHRTSSFEPYDMYAMTAAHKTLPIPSYVRVTNLDNQRSVIVRVNDRGPFHRGRIIDLSWAAAQKLGYAGSGTARVRVEAIEPPAADVPVAADAGTDATTNPTAKAAATTAASTAATSTDASTPAGTAPANAAAPLPADPDAPHGYFVQLGAFTFPDAARQLGERVRANTGEPVVIIAGDDTLHRVRVGPYEDRASAERIRDLLVIAGLGTPALVFVPAPVSP